MGTKADLGKFDCYANAASDEPMFVLLGRDKHAPTLVWMCWTLQWYPDTPVAFCVFAAADLDELMAAAAKGEVVGSFDPFGERP